MRLYKYLRKLDKPEYHKRSYSQCGEDLIIKFIFDQLQIDTPSFLDIGAHHPFYLSNTALMYENGSIGVSIEPDPELFKIFPKYRKRDQNLNIGISEVAGISDFYHISSPTLNTFSEKEAENYSNEGDYRITAITKIPVDTLKNIVRFNCGGQFPKFLNIDAEGVDELIIKSIDFRNSYPLVICVETISFSTSRKGIKNHNLIEFICNQGYLLYADTYINTIFVRNDIWRT